MTFTYRSIHGEDRIVRAEIAALGLAVDYEYDDRGNLLKATRSGQNLAGAESPPPSRASRATATSRCRGGAGAPAVGRRLRKEHQLVETTDPNGNRREYVYYGETDPLPGEDAGGGGLLFEEKWERVRQVVEHPAPALSIRTEFSYDLRDAITRAEWKTTVRDGRGNDTRLRPERQRQPTARSRSPSGKTTRMTWAPDDILKLQRDATPNGRVTEFGYDPRGNLTLERVADPGPRACRDRVRLRRALQQADASRRTPRAGRRATRSTLEPATCWRRVDAVGNGTEYAYDAHGRLLTVDRPAWRRHRAPGPRQLRQRPRGRGPARQRHHAGLRPAGAAHQTVGHDGPRDPPGVGRPRPPRPRRPRRRWRLRRRGHRDRLLPGRRGTPRPQRERGGDDVHDRRPQPRDRHRDPLRRPGPHAPRRRGTRTATRRRRPTAGA